ncbi:hypothetical protein KSS87_004331 [Heliosperma pusillum]|nr:hypothetical protein KSS87_004331 [Heliosperma pusillum]
MVQSLGERMSRTVNIVHDPSLLSTDDQSEMGHTTRRFMDLLGGLNEANHVPNRLSLSLGSQVIQSPYSMQYKQTYGNNLVSSCEDTCNLPSDYSFMGSGSSFPAFAVSNSVYLQPAQSILEEMIDLRSKNVELSEIKRLFLSGRGVCTELRAELLSNGLLSSDKHEIQFNLSKLISLLEQVEGRYDEYTQRMEDLISSFEVIAGEGAAKCYTALALQAMCRHFCNLRDAIITQIKLARKKLCPELSKSGTGLSHLNLFSQQGRNSNTRLTLQQIAVIQGTHRQAWRPIRGLPDTSVAILRAWLFEHFLHPYPNDSEKLTLASQTGLSKNQVNKPRILYKKIYENIRFTLSVSFICLANDFWYIMLKQVSNWFINARVRLWKPMIEEMYKEEFGESAVDSSGDDFTDRPEE